MKPYLTEQQFDAQQIEVMHTKDWLNEIVIGLNFCPFAKKEFVNNTIGYITSDVEKLDQALEQLALACEHLVEHQDVETSLLIFTTGFKSFERFLALVDYANDLIVSLGYEGTIQLANFHPDYFFDGESATSPSHYTNRSPYPTLHLIREESMERVLNLYPDPESIPENNIELAEQKGNQFFEQALKRIKNRY